MITLRSNKEYSMSGKNLLPIALWQQIDRTTPNFSQICRCKQDKINVAAVHDQYLYQEALAT